MSSKHPSTGAETGRSRTDVQARPAYESDDDLGTADASILRTAIPGSTTIRKRVSKPAPAPEPEPEPQAAADPGAADVNLEAPAPTYSFWVGALMVRGSVTPRVVSDVLGFGLLAAATVFVCQMIEHMFGLHLGVKVGPFEAAGAILGLLLVLRTNAGYDRWWEARKLWGGIVNQSRNLAITALAYGPPDSAWRVRFIRWVAAFPHTVRRSLRGEREFPEIERLIGVDEAARLAAASHMPDYVAKELANMLRVAQAAGMNAWGFYEAERQRGLLIDHLGGCERILRTPLARATAIQVRRFILLFLGTLPFALLGDLEGSLGEVNLLGVRLNADLWLVPLFIMLLAYPLLSLDRIGMELQNPFDRKRLDHLPLDRICLTIEGNLMELLNAYSAPGERPLAPDPVQPAHDASLTMTVNPFNADIS
jgi:putative membrane protein